MQKPGGGADTWGRVGHVRQLSLHPACTGKPLGAFRQVDDALGNTCSYKPTHAPDRALSLPPTCYVAARPSIHILTHRVTRPLSPPGRAVGTWCWLPAKVSDIYPTCLLVLWGRVLHSLQERLVFTPHLHRHARAPGARVQDHNTPLHMAGGS